MPDDAHQLQPEAQQTVLEIYRRFGEDGFISQATVDAVPTLWIEAGRILEVLRFLKTGIEHPYRMLYDLTAIDERLRKHRQGC